MTQYVVVVHNITQDQTEYYGPYGDADISEYYKEINSFYGKEPEDYNCYVIELRTFTLSEEEQNYASEIERREP
jgi:hypothetical protein